MQYQSNYTKSLSSALHLCLANTLIKLSYFTGHGPCLAPYFRDCPKAKPKKAFPLNSENFEPSWCGFTTAGCCSKATVYMMLLHLLPPFSCPAASQIYLQLAAFILGWMQTSSVSWFGTGISASGSWNSWQEVLFKASQLWRVWQRCEVCIFKVQYVNKVSAHQVGELCECRRTADREGEDVQESWFCV